MSHELWIFFLAWKKDVGLMPLCALYPSKSGLMNKHIVKHIGGHFGWRFVKHIAIGET